MDHLSQMQLATYYAGKLVRNTALPVHLFGLTAVERSRKLLRVLPNPAEVSFLSNGHLQVNVQRIWSEDLLLSLVQANESNRSEVAHLSFVNTSDPLRSTGESVRSHPLRLPDDPLAKWPEL